MTSLLKELKIIIGIPRQEFVAACIVLGLVVMAWTLDSFLNPNIMSSDLNSVAAVVAKDIDPTLFPRDNRLAHPELYEFYTPLYRWVVARLWLITGALETSLLWLASFVVSLYLVAMFILLRYVINNGWIALGLTVASAHYRVAMSDGVWGAGGSSEMSARTLFLPAALFLMLLYLHTLDKPNWRKGLIFGLLFGLASNMHPISGFHLLAVLSVLIILVHGNHYKGWQTLLAMGLGTVIGIWPFTTHYFANAHKSISDNVAFDEFSQIVIWYRDMPFRPDTFEWPLFDLRLTRPALDVLVWFYFGLVILSFLFYIWGQHHRPGLIRWVWLIAGLITVAYAYMIALFHMTFLFAVVAFYIIYRFRQGEYSKLDGRLITLTGLVVLYSFVGYYILTLIWQTFEVWSLTSLLIQYARAARFIYLPIYLLTGLGGVALLEVLKNKLHFVSRYRNETALSVNIAIIFALGPAILFGAHRQMSTTLAAIAILILLSVTTFLVLTKVDWTPRNTFLAVGVAVLILFGPFAPFLTDYLSVPVRNLLSPNSWVVEPVARVDVELYDWVSQNTAQDTLFYGCLDHKTLTYFRRVAQRSLTHNWKDFGPAIHNGAALVPAYNKFRSFQRACRDFNDLIGSLHHSGADYLFISRDAAGEFLHEACFVNERYVVFAANQNSCLTVE